MIFIKNMKIQKIIIIVAGLIFAISFTGCKKESRINKVNINQINRDNSNNYRYLFREEIAKERRQEKYKERRTFTK